MIKVDIEFYREDMCNSPMLCVLFPGNVISPSRELYFRGVEAVEMFRRIKPSVRKPTYESATTVAYEGVALSDEFIENWFPDLVGDYCGRGGEFFGRN